MSSCKDKKEKGVINILGPINTDIQMNSLRSNKDIEQCTIKHSGLRN